MVAIAHVIAEQRADRVAVLAPLLLEPALATGRTRLVIVPDGALWTLPFQALRGTADLVEWRWPNGRKVTCFAN